MVSRHCLDTEIDYVMTAIGRKVRKLSDGKKDGSTCRPFAGHDRSTSSSTFLHVDKAHPRLLEDTTSSTMQCDSYLQLAEDSRMNVRQFDSIPR
jgi:hypothetical protein